MWIILNVLANHHGSHKVLVPHRGCEITQLTEREKIFTPKIDAIRVPSAALPQF